MKKKTAHFLGQIVAHLDFTGCSIEARECASDAVLLWQSLVAENPDSNTPNLACQLGSLGTQLSRLNQHTELLGITKESIILYQSLVDKNPVSYTPNLAWQLGSLGVWLSNLNWHEESLGATQESITLY